MKLVFIATINEAKQGIVDNGGEPNVIVMSSHTKKIMEVGDSICGLLVKVDDLLGEQVLVRHEPFRNT